MATSDEKKSQGFELKSNSDPQNQSKTQAIPQEAFDWYDEYAHGYIDRREFFGRLAGLAALGFSMTVLTSALLPNYAKAEQVSFNDPKITGKFVTFESPDGHGECRGYLVTPKELVGSAPVVLVVHENRGLNPYIQDVARRLAVAGYVAFAPDALYPVGGYPGNDDEGRAMQSQMDAQKLEADFIAAAKFIKGHELSSGKLGVVGFCYGGYITNMLSATLPDEVDAGVPYYGTPAKGDLTEKVKGPLLLQFAELDKRVNDTWPDYEATLKKNNAKYEAYVYEGVNHGFHNDSTARYAKKEAELSWKRTLDFFKANLA